MFNDKQEPFENKHLHDNL